MKTMEKFLGILGSRGVIVSETIREELIRITQDKCTYEARLHHHKQIKIINQIMEEYRIWKNSN